MDILKLFLLVVFSIILVIGLLSVADDISNEGLGIVKKKTFFISLAACGFSLFLVLKVSKDLL